MNRSWHAGLVRGVGLALALGSLAGALGPTVAEARRPAAKAVAVKTAQAFRAADLNANRQLDQAEWATAGRPAETFALVDRNADAQVSFWEALLAVLVSLKAKASGR